MAVNLSSDAMRFRWYLLVAAWAVAAIGLGAVIVEGQDDATDGSDQVLDRPDATGAPASPADQGEVTDDPVIRPASGQVRISGTVTVLRLEGALLEPRLVPTPLTVVSDRGFGNGGEITGAQVARRDSEIVWDGGRPFVLSSGPGLVLDPVSVELVPEGLRLLLGGGVHGLEAGEYRLNTPVAVGSGGLATAHDALTFLAGPDTLFAASGDTALVLGPAGPHRFLGPGGIHLEGDLEVLDDRGRSAQSTFDIGEGAFDLVLTPGAAGGWTVTGICDAP
jgi:hypothetical protein